MTLNAYLLSNDAIKFSLYLDNPGFFSSSWILKVNKVDEIKVLDQAIDLPPQFEESYPLKIYHGPWIAKKYFPDLRWYNRLAPGKVSISTNAHGNFNKLIEYIDFKLNWLGSLNIYSRISKRYDSLKIVYDVYPLARTSLLYVEGNLGDWLFSDDIALKKTVLSMKINTDILGLLIPKLYFEGELAGSEDLKLYFQDFFFNFKVKESSPKTSVNFGFQAYKAYKDEHVFNQINLNCKLEDALSKNYDAVQFDYLSRLKTLVSQDRQQIMRQIDSEQFLDDFIFLRASSFNCGGEFFKNDMPLYLHFQISFEDLDPLIILQGDATTVKLMSSYFFSEDLQQLINQELKNKKDLVRLSLRMASKEFTIHEI